MTPYELISAKRDGGALPPEAIATFLSDYARGRVPDYQMAALCMAICFRGLSGPELRAWTVAMRASGGSLDLSHVAGPKVDKHSTGGVGDKVSLVLAPLVAACGVRVPMVSGRGLGHTGGRWTSWPPFPAFAATCRSTRRRTWWQSSVCASPARRQRSPRRMDASTRSAT